MVINPEFEKLIPALTAEEFNQLELNCIAEGIREPLIIWNDTLIDGHNRYKIALKNNLIFGVLQKDFENESDVKVWMIKNQFGRRNLNNYQRSVLALELESVFSEKAKEKELIRKSTFQISEKSEINLFKEEKKEIEEEVWVKKEIVKPETINSVKEIAKISNVSHDTIAKVKVIEQKATPEQKQLLQKGDTSINSIYQEIKKVEKNIELKEKVIQQRIETSISENIINGNSLEILETLEDNCIDIVLTDPPYGINYVSNRSEFDSVTKRGLMNDGLEAFDLLEKICEILSRKCSINSHLYFFCSFSVFSKFESIISKYFTIKTPLVWDKGNKGSGDLENDWGNQVELVIYCTKGKKGINNRRGNLLFYPRLHTTKMVHPTQKPIELLSEILSVSYKEGDFIVDPFMGSGSTIKACNLLKAKSLGIELDSEMFNIANNFINGN